MHKAIVDLFFSLYIIGIIDSVYVDGIEYSKKSLVNIFEDKVIFCKDANSADSTYIYLYWSEYGTRWTFGYNYDMRDMIKFVRNKMAEAEKENK